MCSRHRQHLQVGLPAPQPGRRRRGQLPKARRLPLAVAGVDQHGQHRREAGGGRQVSRHLLAQQRHVGVHAQRHARMRRGLELDDQQRLGVRALRRRGADGPGHVRHPPAGAASDLLGGQSAQSPRVQPGGGVRRQQGEQVAHHVRVGKCDSADFVFEHGASMDGPVGLALATSAMRRVRDRPCDVCELAENAAGSGLRPRQTFARPPPEGLGEQLPTCLCRRSSCRQACR